MLAVEYSLVFKFDDVGQPSLCKIPALSINRIVEVVQYIGGKHQYREGNISTERDRFSTVDGIQYMRRITSVLRWGIPSVQWGTTSVQ